MDQITYFENKFHFMWKKHFSMYLLKLWKLHRISYREGQTWLVGQSKEIKANQAVARCSVWSQTSYINHLQEECILLWRNWKLKDTKNIDNKQWKRCSQPRHDLAIEFDLLWGATPVIYDVTERKYGPYVEQDTWNSVTDTSNKFPQKQYHIQITYNYCG